MPFDQQETSNSNFIKELSFQYFTYYAGFMRKQAKMRGKKEKEKQSSEYFLRKDTNDFLT
jgi:hypothetical protein